MTADNSSAYRHNIIVDRGYNMSISSAQQTSTADMEVERYEPMTHPFWLVTLEHLWPRIV